MFGHRCESYLHNTDDWFVRKINGTIEPFNGDKLKRAIVASIKNVNNSMDYDSVIPDVDRLATTVTIQVCKELQRLLRNKKIEKDGISTILIRYFCERELAITYFDAAKSYIVEGAKHLQSQCKIDMSLICELNQLELGLR